MNKSRCLCVFVSLLALVGQAQESTQRKPLERRALFVEHRNDTFSVKQLTDTGDFVFEWTGYSGDIVQMVYVPGNKLDVLVKASVETEGPLHSLRYRYEITNLGNSQQNACNFVVENTGSAFGIETPEGWNQAALSFTPALNWYSCTKPDILGLAAGESTHGFSFKAPRTSGAQAYVHSPTKETGIVFYRGSMPGIVRCWVRGYTGGLESPEELPESLTKLIPRFPNDSAVGPTVGPVGIPWPFDSVTFAERLASFVNESLEAGWISPQLAERCSQITAEIRRNLESENQAQARQLLSELIQIAEEQRNNEALTSEGYALIKYNAEYLIYASRR